MMETKTMHYNIIAYPLDAIVTTPKLYFVQQDGFSQCWSYDKQQAATYTEYMQAFTDLMQIKRKNQTFLILLDNEYKTN